MTTLKKDEKRSSKKSKKGSQKAPGRSTKPVKEDPVRNSESKQESEETKKDRVKLRINANALEKSDGGKFERKPSFRRKIGLLIRSSAELPAVINRGLEPIRRSLSFSKDLNRLQEPNKPYRTGSVQWYNSLVSLAEDECLDGTDINRTGNSSSEELLSPKVQVTRTQSLIDTSFARSARRRVNELRSRTARYGRYSDHYDSSIDLSNPPCEASSLPALTHTAIDESCCELLQQQVSRELRIVEARNSSLLYVGQFPERRHTPSHDVWNLTIEPRIEEKVAHTFILL